MSARKSWKSAANIKSAALEQEISHGQTVIKSKGPKLMALIGSHCIPPTLFSFNSHEAFMRKPIDRMNNSPYQDQSYATTNEHKKLFFTELPQVGHSTVLMMRTEHIADLDGIVNPLPPLTHIHMALALHVSETIDFLKCCYSIFSLWTTFFQFDYHLLPLSSPTCDWTRSMFVESSLLPYRTISAPRRRPGRPYSRGW